MIKNTTTSICPKCSGRIHTEQVPSGMAKVRTFRTYCIMCAKTIKELEIPDPPMIKPDIKEPPHVIQVAGISLYTDTFAYYNNSLYFLSCVGATHDLARIKQTIQNNNTKFSKIAHIVPRTALEYKQKLTAFNLALTPLINGKVWQQQMPKLGQNQQHIILRAQTPINKSADYSFPVFSVNEEQFSRSLYEQLQRHTEIIAIPQWAKEIHQICINEQWLTTMTCYGNIVARMCRPNPYILQQLIQEAVQGQQLPLFLDEF